MAKDFPEIRHQFDPWHWIKVIYLVCLISSLWIIRRENPMITCAEYPISYVEEEGQTPWNLAPSDRQTPVVGIDII